MVSSVTSATATHTEERPPLQPAAAAQNFRSQLSAAMSPELRAALAPFIDPPTPRVESPAAQPQPQLQPVTGPPTEVRELDQPIENQYGYTGPAARNPYFTSPENPLRPGYVAPFESWFEDNAVHGPEGFQSALSRRLTATEAGAKEALRLVRQYIPEATLVQNTWGGGPYGAEKKIYHVRLPNGPDLNAAAILTSYYFNGYGACTLSDRDLQVALGVKRV